MDESLSKPTPSGRRFMRKYFIEEESAPEKDEVRVSGLDR